MAIYEFNGKELSLDCSKVIQILDDKDKPIPNSCVVDCAGELGGSAFEDCQGICGGDAILDECIIGTWIAVNLDICGVEYPPSDVCFIFYENNTFERCCCACEENQPISGTWSVENDELYLSFDTYISSSLDENILVVILDISWWGEEEEPCLSNPTIIYTYQRQ